jgi:hypothetical protein
VCAEHVCARSQSNRDSATAAATLRVREPASATVTNDAVPAIASNPIVKSMMATSISTSV